MELKAVDPSIDSLIEKIENSHANLIRLYRSVPVNEVVEPVLANGWSVKDVVAHLAMWEWRCALMLEESHSTNFPLQAEPDVEALNKEAYEERKEWNWEEVEYDARAAHKALLKAISQMPPDRLTDEVVYKSIAIDTWEHYAGHIPDLEQWHKQVISNR